MNWGRGLAAACVVLLVIGGFMYAERYSESTIFLVAAVVAGILSVAGFVAQKQRTK